MTNAKVTVTKEVAEALYGVEHNCIGINIALTLHAKNDLTGEYAPLQSLSIEDLAKALINGYQVEKSPEDKVREYYDRCNANYKEADVNNSIQSANHFSGQATGVSITLDILGIKIEGGERIMERLATEEIEEIRKRAEQATEGPWRIEKDSYVCNAGYHTTDTIISPDITSEVYEEADAEFIANARTDIPKLLAEVERLREDMAEIAEIVSDFYTEQGGMRLPSHLAPIAGELSVIHKIALGGGK